VGRLLPANEEWVASFRRVLHLLLHLLLLPAEQAEATTAGSGSLTPASSIPSPAAAAGGAKRRLLLPAVVALLLLLIFLLLLLLPAEQNEGGRTLLRTPPAVSHRPHLEPPRTSSAFLHISKAEEDQQSFPHSPPPSKPSVFFILGLLPHLPPPFTAPSQRSPSLMQQQHARDRSLCDGPFVPLCEGPVTQSLACCYCIQPHTHRAALATDRRIDQGRALCHGYAGSLPLSHTRLPSPFFHSSSQCQSRP
jgi:hypothetical protein